MLIYTEKIFTDKILSRLPALISRVYLIAAVLIGWVFFYHTSLNQAFRYLGVMSGINADSLADIKTVLIFNNNIFFILIALISCTPFAAWLYALLGSFLSKYTGSSCKLDYLMAPLINTVILMLSIVMLVGQSYNPFLYFRF